MSINEKMTAIADGVRALDGSTAALTLDGIAAGLAAEKSHVDAALVAIAGKGVTVPSGSLSADLEGLIGQISGGDTLNFDVVGGTTQPATPTENTVWINTADEINAWAFGSKAPDEPTDGMVWVVTPSNGVASINVLKENEISIFVSSAYQYADGEWASRNVQVYQGGQWLQYADYLIKNGALLFPMYSYGNDWSTTESFGFNNTAVSEDDGYVRVYSTTSGYGRAVFEDTFDLTNIDQIEMAGTFTHYNGHAYLAVWSQLNLKIAENLEASVAIPKGTAQRFSLDVSGLTGLYYVGVTTQASADYKLTEVRLK